MGRVAVLGFPGEVQRHLRLAPHCVEWIVPQEKACDTSMHAAQASKVQITPLNREAKACPHEIDHARDRLRPKGNRCHRVVGLRLVGNKAVLLDQVAGELGETVGVAVTVKHRPEHSPPIAIGMRGSAARPVLHANADHAAHLQAKQPEVSKVGGRTKDREDLHGGLQFRICHQRQINQALDRAPVEGLPDRLVFGQDLLLGRARRKVNAEQAQARECAVHSLRVLRLRDVELDLQVVDGRLIDFRFRALQQPDN